MDPEAIRQAPLVAIAATVAFFILAFLLLYPVWRFLNREEEVSRRWTPEEMARAARHERHGGDGASKEQDAEGLPRP